MGVTEPEEAKQISGPMFLSEVLCGLDLNEFCLRMASS